MVKGSAVDETAAIGLAGIGYCLPQRRLSLHELAECHLVDSQPSALELLGFGHVHIAEEDDELRTMSLRAASDALAAAAVGPEQVGALVHATAIAPSTLAATSEGNGALLHVEDLQDFFRYAATRLQFDLGLSSASVIGVDQQACASLFGAIRIARALLVAEPELAHVLCVSADRIPRGTTREVVYNPLSDGACAVVVSHQSPLNRILGCYQVTKGYYWDGVALRNELLASYFPTARRVILGAVERAGLELEEVDWLVPHNTSARGWDILAGALGFPRSRIYTANIGQKGHCIAADNLINLRDMESEGLLSVGQKMLLFNFGFGANWSTVILER